MVLASLLFFLPAFALSSKDSVAIVPAEDLKVCEYFDARIVRLREIVNKELGPDVDIGSDLYTTLEESKLCDTVGYVAIPECVANNGGDECVARKTSELIRKTLRAAMKAEKIKQLPSGEKFFATCKHIGYKNVLKTFKSARTLMSPECGLPGLGGGRSRRSLDLLPALLLGGSYDPSSIWFQYFLCKDIDLYCYFFTQGWTQGQYGQYYLYDNLLDDTNGLFAGSTDSSNLATIALLGGLGGGIGQPSGYYPSYGAHAAAPAPGRKRREQGVVGDEDKDEVNRRKRRAVCDDDENCTDRKRREGEKEDEDTERKRREACDRDDSLPFCPRRKRSPESEEEDEDRKRRAVCDDDENCIDRKRREGEKEDDDKERNRRDACDRDDLLPYCPRRKRSPEREEEEDEDRKRREACDVDDKSPSCRRRKRRSAVCDDNDDSKPNCPKRNRRSASNEACAENDANCHNKNRKRRQACEACKINPDSTECDKCLNS